MAITARARQALKSELTRLEKERAAIDKDIKSLTESLKTLGGSTPRKKSTRKATRKAAPRKAGAKRGRPSKRQDQVLKAVKASPGITVSEIAKKHKVKNATTFYPAVKSLTKDKKLKKKGSKLYAA